MSDPLNPKPGDRFTFQRGEIRIDEVTAEQVYFVAWRGEQEYGEPKRMTLDVWRQAITTEIQRDAEFRMPPVPPKVYEERDRMIAAHGPASLGLPENLLRSDGPARALAVELGKELKDA